MNSILCSLVRNGAVYVWNAEGAEIWRVPQPLFYLAHLTLAALRKWSAVYFTIYEKHSIMCPAVHTVAKRMRLIVSGLMKLSSSFIFRARIFAFSVCSKKAFARLSNLPNGSFQSARNYLTLPRHDLQKKPKSHKPLLPHLLFLTQQARNIICHCLIDFWPATLVGYLMWFYSRFSEEEPSSAPRTHWGTRASTSHAAWPTLNHKLFTGQVTLLRGVRRCEQSPSS